MFGRSKSEVELLRASREGSTQAFEVVVARYQSLVCAITYGATGDVQRSEELAQEAFLQAWKCLGQLKDLGKFRAWLCRIARSTVQNWFRSRRHDVVGRAAPLDVAAEKASDESGPEEVVMSKEQQAVVRQALARMPEGLREPLILFYREGCSTREVAELLGLSENATRQRISRGRSLLREQMADMIETTIARTKPGKAFTAAVVASIAGLGVKGTATAVAATGVVSGMSALTGKIATLAAGAVIVAGGIVAYTRSHKPVRPPQQPIAAYSIRQGQPAPLVPPTTGEAGDMAAAPKAPVTALRSDSQADHQLALDPNGAGTAVVEEQPKPFEFQPRGVLSGLVTDAQTGEPVRDARLTISLRSVYTPQTDEHGFYYLDQIDEAGSYRISLVSRDYAGIPDDDHATVVHLDPNQQTIQHFALAKACLVNVWVVDANGVGIGDATVIGASLADPRGREVNGSVFGSPRTDPDGHVLLGGFAPAQTDYQITAWHRVQTGAEIRMGRSWPTSEYDYAPARAIVRLTDPNVVTEVKIVLEKGEPVHGYIQYADGAPATDVTIAAQPVWWHANYSAGSYPVNPDGTFTLKHVVSGLHDISISISTGDYSSTSRTLRQSQLPMPNAEPLVLCLDERSPQSLVAISGSLVFRGERPSHVDVRAESAGGKSVRADVRYKSPGVLEDTFVVDRLEPGLYRLVFTGSNIEEKVIGNVTAPSSGLQVELVYTTKPKLTGTVVDAETGAPIEDFRLRLRKIHTLRGSNWAQPDRWTLFDRSRGRFSIDVVGPGVYQVQVAAEGYAPTWSREINTDEIRALELRLSAAGGVEGRVVDEMGEPVHGAKVIPLSLASGATPSTSSMFMSEQGAVETVDGSFVLRNLPAGKETLKVTHPDYADGLIRNIRVVEGETTADVKIIVTQGGTVEGHVYDEKGRLLVGEIISFYDRDGYNSPDLETAGRLATAVTDSNGFYRVARLPQQLCYVKRANASRGLGVTHRMAVPRNGDTVRLDFGGAPVVSGIVVIDGHPLSKSRLLLGPASSPFSAMFKCYAMTDENGAFAFPGVAPGTYGIYRAESGEPPRRLGTVTVADANVDTGIIPNDASKLFITVTGPGGTDAWAIDELCLAEGQQVWPSPTGQATRPQRESEPWIIDNVRRGSHTLLIMRLDQVLWRKPVTLEAGQTRWDLSLELPTWDAWVSGRIHGDTTGDLMFWRREKDVVGPLACEKDGTFRIGPLPPGRYFVGEAPGYLRDAAIAEFTLREGEERMLDLDLSASSRTGTAYLVVQVVDATGGICPHARVRLDGPGGSAELVYATEAGCTFMSVPGEHSLHVEATGYRSVNRKVSLEPGNGDAPAVVLCLERP